MMPDRDMLLGAPEVVWGITTLPNGAATTYTIDFGNGVVSAPAAVVDRSYIAVNNTYALSGPYTVTLTVRNGAITETATVKVNVYNGSLLSAQALRELNINRAIQNGMRYLWTSQTNRTTFDTNVQTSWGGIYPNPYTSLVVQAFQNQGYRLPNSNALPIGIYAKYAVRRGLNFNLARLTTLAIGTTPAPASNDPCVGALPAATRCSALFANTTVDPGYENGIALLALAGSGALNRINSEVVTANVVGQTYGEILQRMVNASIWGQNDTSTGRGGWFYTFNSTSSDGSTNGWQLLALLDAEAAGATVPPWVRTEWNFALLAGVNNDGSYDYQANANPTSNNAVNVAKTGVGIQGMFFSGRPATDSGLASLASAKTWIGARWANQNTGQSFVCGNSTYNKGCAYGMYNVFKGFKLYGIQTLAGVGRPAGPGLIPADDWYADYEDWLVTNQTSPTAITGGNWIPMSFSSQTDDASANAAIALLILSPTALVLPDPVTFSALGLQQGSPLSTNPATNPVTIPPGTHMVTGLTVATNGSPIPGVTVGFRILTGPNAGATGSGNTGVNGQTTFTYTGTGGAGTDTIQANVGALLSNVLVKNWVVQGIVCDVNNDQTVTMADLLLIRSKSGQPATGANAIYDTNRDGSINVADVRYCQLRLTPASVTTKQ